MKNIHRIQGFMHHQAGAEYFPCLYCSKKLPGADSFFILDFGCRIFINCILPGLRSYCTCSKFRCVPLWLRKRGSWVRRFAAHAFAD